MSRKCLPKDINPKIKEQVDAVLGGEGPVAAAHPPPPAPARGGKAGGGGGGGGKAAAAPPPPRGGKASQAVANVAKGLPPSPPTPPPLPAADDPAPFEEELSQREAQLGPDHPDVAETCSNLAIL